MPFNSMKIIPPFFKKGLTFLEKSVSYNNRSYNYAK